MKNLTIKTRLIILAVIGLLTLSGSISISAVNKANSELLAAQFNKLSTVTTSKSGEILEYFKSLEGLLISLANHKGTQDAFEDFEKGFYILQGELKLNIPKVIDTLKLDFSKNYISQVNYEIPNSSKKRNINSYLPKNVNALLAQYIFISKNEEQLGEKNKMIYNGQYDSSYMRAHKSHHNTFNTFLKSFDLYDVFMVDLKGNLIYSVFKEKDYSTNLKNGVYKNSGIAKVYEKALRMEKNELAFNDFAPYEPSYNSAASFIATPLYINNEKKGVLIFQMPVGKINTIMSFHGQYKEAGLGNSGEAYLVGEDFKMRNDSRFTQDINDPIIKKLGSTIGVWEVKTKSSKAILNENINKGKAIIYDYRGVEVLSVYNSISLFGQAKWALISEIDEEEALLGAVELRNNILLISLGILGVVVLFFLYFINILVARPLESLNKGILNLLHSNDTSSRVDLHSKDEIGKIALNFNTYLEKIEEGLIEDEKVIQNVSQIVNEVSMGSLSKRVTATTSNNTVQNLVDELNNMMISLQKTINHSLDTLKAYQNHDYRVKTTLRCTGEICELMQGIDDLGSSISFMLVENTKNGNILDNSAQTLLENVDSLNQESMDAATNLEETAAALEEINSSIKENTNNIVQMSNYSNELIAASNEGQTMANKTTLSIEEINSQVSAINDAIGVIDQIAFQTNILSLNAAVEAATAGELGKGFAVVAQEVRNLSSRSAQAAKEIKVLVENATSKAKEAKTIANDMSTGYKDLYEKIEDNVSLIKNIEFASKEQATAIAQINDSINSLDQQTQRNVVVVNNTYDISIETFNIAVKIVTDANEKEFLGKTPVILTAGKVEENSNNTLNELLITAANEDSYVASEGKDNWGKF